MGKPAAGARRWLAGLVLLVPGLVLAAPQPAEYPGLQVALGQLTAAFSTGDADRLAPLLPARGKVQVALPGLEVAAGYYSSGQCRYLLADAFRRFPVQSFRLAPVPDPGAGRQVTARGQLIAGPRGQQGRHLQIHFLLSREDEGWVLREVRQQSGP
jgi:hypothetical protein